MRKLLSTAAAAAVLGLSGAPAQAAPFIGSFDAGSESMTFNSTVVCAVPGTCLFNDAFNFFTPAGYQLVSVSLSTTSVSGDNVAGDIDFTGGDLNGSLLSFSVDFPIGPTSVMEIGGLGATAIGAAPNILTVAGQAWTNGAYSGTLNFAKVAVPEPATWLMMILGFGLVGGMLRSRRQSAPRVNFAF